MRSDGTEDKTSYDISVPALSLAHLPHRSHFALPLTAFLMMRVSYDLYQSAQRTHPRFAFTHLLLCFAPLLTPA
jgi:hypothetical protein